MKTKNFPARVERRRLRAEMPKGQKVEPEISDTYRNTRTKIRKNDRYRAVTH
jgi:hypothetical protein